MIIHRDSHGVNAYELPLNHRYLKPRLSRSYLKSKCTGRRSSPGIQQPC